MEFPFGTKVLEEVKSSINGKISVIRSLGFGTYIQVEGLTQSGGIVRDVWRTALKKVKKQFPSVKSCLILGLGGGSAAGLVKKYWPEAKITGVDIDPTMVSLGEKYLKLEGVDVEIADAYDFAEKAAKKRDKYDLVLIDTYVGDKYPEKFESQEFILLVNRLLAKRAIAIFNRLYYDEKRPQAVKFGAKLEKVFPSVECLYPQANLMLICSATIEKG
jgi:spermidine synthase